VKRLQVVDFGDTNIVQGVRLRGDRRNPEPESFRVAFPGGDVDVVRTTDGEYWVHVRVDRPGKSVAPPDEAVYGRIVDARLDVLGRHTSDVSVGDFADPELYHLAVRVALDATPKLEKKVDQGPLFAEATP